MRYVIKAGSTSIMVDSGLYFDPQNPRAIDVDIDDIAHSAGQTVRFNGHTTRPITTAEHMARVGRIAGAIAPPGFADESRFWGHIHDAHEAFTPWGDCLSPGKTSEMREVEGRIDAAIVQRLLGWPLHPSDEARTAVRRADVIALYFEAMLWQRHGSDWAIALFGESPPDNSLLPLIAPRRGETLVESLVSNTWVGAAWLRELWRIWPAGLSQRDPPISRYIQRDGASS
jgi:hypothetical protein